MCQLCGCTGTGVCELSLLLRCSQKSMKKMFYFWQKLEFWDQMVDSNKLRFGKSSIQIECKHTKIQLLLWISFATRLSEWCFLYVCLFVDLLWWMCVHELYIWRCVNEIESERPAVWMYVHCVHAHSHTISTQTECEIVWACCAAIERSNTQANRNGTKGYGNGIITLFSFDLWVY